MAKATFRRWKKSYYAKMVVVVLM